MPSGARVFLVVVAAGFVLLAYALLTERTTLAFPFGTASSAIAVVLQPGSTACQAPIDVPSQDAFDRLVLQLGTYKQPGPSLSVVVRDPSRRAVAAGRLRSGYPDVDRAPRHSIDLHRLVDGEALSVCVRNSGVRRVAIYGSGGDSARPSSLRVDGRQLGTDMNIEFRRPGRSFAAIADEILRRAALWRSPRLDGATYGLTLAFLLLAGTCALFIALRRIDTSDTSTGDSVLADPRQRADAA